MVVILAEHAMGRNVIVIPRHGASLPKDWIPILSDRIAVRSCEETALTRWVQRLYLPNQIWETKSDSHLEQTQTDGPLTPAPLPRLFTLVPREKVMGGGEG